METESQKHKRLWPVDGICLAQILEWQKSGYTDGELQAVADEAGVSKEEILRRFLKHTGSGA